MNIGIVTTWFERGAAYVSKQYMELLEESHEVFIYARGGEKYAKNNSNWDGGNIHWGKKDIFQLKATPIHRSDFENWIDRCEVEVLLFNEQQWWEPILWAKKKNILVGAYIDYYTKDTVLLFEIYDFLICNTKRHFSVFNWHKQCYYLPWGTDTNLFRPQNKNIKDEDKVVFFNSSGYNPDRKGVDKLLKAFYNLKSKDKKLILHSQINLTTYYKELTPIITSLINNEELEIISDTVTAPGLYHLGDVYCYISKLDGIGLTLIEAISCGLQSIVPDNAPMNEFIDESINGKLVKVDSYQYRKDGYYWPENNVNTNDLENKMLYYLENKDKIKKMKKDSRLYAEKYLNWLDRKEELSNIFKTVKPNKTNSNIESKILSYESKMTKSLSLYEIIKIVYKTIKR
jgi:1,2-diacylglycerol 3-alpha-glucosyltransferase